MRPSASWRETLYLSPLLVWWKALTHCLIAVLVVRVLVIGSLS